MKSLLKLGLALGIAIVAFTVPGGGRVEADNALCCAECGPINGTVCCPGAGCAAVDGVGCVGYVGGQKTPTYCPGL